MNHLFYDAYFIIMPILIIIVKLIIPIIIAVLLIRALLKYIHSDVKRNEKSAIKTTLGQRLKEHRQRCQMTQEFVAEKLGVSRQAVSKWESGSSEPSTTNLIAISKLYGTTVEELVNHL